MTNEAHNKQMRAIRDGGLRRRKVWLVTAAEGGKRGGEHNNQPKEGRAMAVRAVAAATVEARAMVVTYAAVRSEETVAMTTTTTTMTTMTATSTMMMAADTSVEAAAMVTVEARTIVAAMAKEGGSVGRCVKQGEEGL